MSVLSDRLDAFLGQSIAQICPNQFHDLSQNHCAHFVSHAVGLTFTYHCREFAGGSQPGGNIRVHEIFARCPKVGHFRDIDRSRPHLVFITAKSHVDLAQKKMVNHPQKHIGIFCDGLIYHYANTADEVVKWTPERFEQVFEQIYAGDQGLYFGSIPGEDLSLTVDPLGDNVARGLAFTLEREGDGTWFAAAKTGVTDRFLVGREFSKTDVYHGLFVPAARYYGPRYAAVDYRARYDHWAELLEVTGWCESKNHFNLINTYDRAKFTFGFFQMAAHTPQDNLILLFRRLLDLPAASAYFPDLQMIDGRVHRVGLDGGTTDLETVMTTGPNGARQLQLFMNYLNPFRWSFDTQEVLQSARLMHWAGQDPDFRALQVEIAVDIVQHKFSTLYHPWYGLDGVSDCLCAIIADIHHQGRGSRNTVASALAAPDPREALLTVNDFQWKNRNRTLRDKIDELEGDGRLGQKVYHAGVNEFG